MTNTPLAVVILAAGKGTRMQSALPKVMHKIAGLPMLGHVIKTAEALQPEKIVVVAAPDQVDSFRALTGKHDIAVQAEQLGTGHAVRAAESALKNFTGNILVLYGDVPLMTPFALNKFLAHKQEKNATLAIMSFEPKNPTGFGRIITFNGELMGIVEQKDLKPGQEEIKTCNTGILCVQSSLLWDWLAKLKNSNAQGEYYLTDVAGMACDANAPRTVFLTDDVSAMGVNDRAQLSTAEYYFQKHARTAAMLNGITLQSPESVIFAHDTLIAPDVTIGANAVFGPGVTIESGAEILPFCHLEDCTIKSGARIGPFARIRPGSVIGEDARIGNFVEVKNSTIGNGAKANHLSYIGDATVGTEANIGAGAITCNYDGLYKHKTEIGRGAFIGSNSALVAPINIGEGALVGAGSVVTKDVPPGALATARAPQKNIFDWATNYFAKGKK